MSKLRVELGEVEGIDIEDHASHASTAIVTGDGDTIHVHFCYSWETGYHFRYFSCCDIFSLPSERVSYSIHKIEKSILSLY